MTTGFCSLVKPAKDFLAMLWTDHCSSLKSISFHINGMEKLKIDGSLEISHLWLLVLEKHESRDPTGTDSVFFTCEASADTAVGMASFVCIPNVWI